MHLPTRLFFVLFVSFTSLVVAPASAHKTLINAVRLEVRPREQQMAAIFRLNAMSAQAWLEAHTKGAVTDVKRIAEFKKDFQKYMWELVSLSHEGGPCTHPEDFYVFHYEEERGSILATTSFTCGPTLPSRLRFTSRLFKEHEIAQDMIVQVENQGKRGHFILNTKGRIHVDFEPDSLLDIGGRLKQVYDAKKADAAVAGDLSSQEHEDEFAISGMTPLEIVREYVVEGFFHIVYGFDHLLFVASLVIAILSLRQLVWILTSFTVGHSISLALGAYDVFRVRTEIIEPLVALTILLVVLDNLLRKGSARERPFVALAFGVIHGFAFSQTLWELEVLDSIVAPLVGFNLGVELGQLALVVPLFPLLAWLRKNQERVFTRFYWATNIFIGCAALYWLIERVGEALA